jgi:hypothetical protein
MGVQFRSAKYFRLADDLQRSFTHSDVFFVARNRTPAQQALGGLVRDMEARSSRRSKLFKEHRMKKISSKKPALTLKKETLRNLTKGELDRVNGGGATAVANTGRPCGGNGGPPSIQ